MNFWLKIYSNVVLLLIILIAFSSFVKQTISDSVDNINKEKYSYQIQNVKKLPRNDDKVEKSTISERNEDMMAFHYKKSSIKYMPSYRLNITSTEKDIRLMKTDLGIFLLSGQQFGEIRVTEIPKRTIFITELLGFETFDITAAEAVAFNDRLIIVIGIYDDHLNVYETSTMADQKSIEPIGRVPIYGRIRRIIFVKKNENTLYLVIGTNFTEIHGRLSLYKWQNSYFELQEEKNLQSLSDLHSLQGDDDATRIIMSVRYGKRKSKTSVQTFAIDDNYLKRIQHLYMDADIVQPYIYNKSYYMLACIRYLKSCTIYRMVDEQFFVYTKEEESRFFNRIVPGYNYFVVQQNDEILTYIDPKMECFGFYKLTQPNLSSIITYMDTNHRNYILLNYIQPNSMFIDILEFKFITETYRIGDSSTFEDGSQSENFVNQLKSLLIRRKTSVDAIRSVMEKLRKSPINIRKRIEKMNNSKQTYIKSGIIDHVKIVNKMLKTPTQMQRDFFNLVEKLKSLSRKISTNSNRKKRTPPKILNVKNLYINDLNFNGSLIEGIIKSENGDLIIRIPTTVSKVTAKELFLYTRSPPQFGLSNNQSNRANTEIDTSVRIRNLIVEKINHFDWNSLYKTAFIKNRDHTIDGNLLIRNSAKIKYLITVQLNNLIVDDFFTLNTDQEIDSNIFVSKFLTSNLTATIVNNLNLENDVVRKGVHNQIQSPIRIGNLIVTGDLELADSDEANFARHIIGTKIEDLSQNYHGKIRINGTLTLRNVLNLSSRDTKIFIDGIPVKWDFENQYWMKSVQQSFKSITFRNKIIAPALIVNDQLNSHPIGNYLERNRNPTEMISLFIRDAHIKGNVYTALNYPSTISGISRQAIRRNDPVTISGNVSFEDNLLIQDLITDSINSIQTKDLVSKLKENIILTGKKHFKRLNISSNLYIDQNIDARFYKKSLNLKEFFTNAVRIDIPSNIDRFYFGSVVDVKNVRTQKLGKNNLSDVTKYFRITNGSLLIRRNIIVDGNVSFSNNLIANTINGINCKDYFNLLVLKNDKNLHQIGGMKIFLANVDIQNNLKVKKINSQNMDEWYQYGLTYSGKQIIIGKWKFKSLTADDITIPLINNLPTKYLIDVRSTSITINSDVICNRLEVLNNITGNFVYNLNDFNESLKNLDLKKIRLLHAVNNAIVLDTEESVDYFDYIVENAIQKDIDQVITGSVVFKNVTKLVNLAKISDNIISGIDIYRLSSDCLLSNSEIPQIVTALKNFINGFEAETLISKNYFDIPIINNIHIIHFNTSIYRLSTNHPIYIRKYFKKSPTIQNLIIQNYQINGVNLQYIVFCNSDFHLPPISIKHLVIGSDFHINQVNGHLEFDVFLRSRVRKYGKAQEVFGYLTFENVIFKKNITISTINDIPIKDVIVMNSDYVQEVYGHKKIRGNLILQGPAHVNQLNGYDIIKKYEMTIFRNKNLHIQRLVVNDLNVTEGIYISEYINQTPVDIFLNINDLVLDKFSNSVKSINKTLNTLEIRGNSLSAYKKFLYLFYDNSIHIYWKKSANRIIKEFIINLNQNHQCQSRNNSHDCVCDSRNYPSYSLLVQISSFNRIYINQISTIIDSKLKFEVKQDSMIVRAENKCEFNEEDWYLSEINAKEQNEALEFNRKFNFTISDVVAFKYGAYKIFIVQCYFSETFKMQIKLIRIDSINFVEEFIVDQFIMSEESFVKLRLFSMGNEKFLIVSVIKMMDTDQNFYAETSYVYSSSKVNIYKFNWQTMSFNYIQSINGEYDLVSLVDLHDQGPGGHIQRRKHLLLSYKDTKKLYIFENNHEDFFHEYQVIVLKEHIDNMLVTTANGIKLSILSMKHSNNYYVYKYNFAQGWTHLTFGYFQNLQYILSLGNTIDQYRNHLLLISSNNSAKALVIHMHP